MKASRYLFIIILVFSTKYCLGQNKMTYSHLLVLKNGASFNIQILELNDSLLIYNSGNHISSIKLSEVNKVVLIQHELDKVNAFGTKFGLSQPKYTTTDSSYRTYGYQYVDSSTINSVSINGPFFIDFGIKIGLISEDVWNYPTSSFLFNFGKYWKLNNHHYLGPSIGLHPFANYNSVLLPIKANYKYILSPNKKRTLSFNAQGGYSLALLEDNSLKNGGFSTSFSISRAKVKTPKRVNEINFGFCYDRFQSTTFVWDPFTRNSQERLRYVFSNRFFISKTWWFN